MENFAPNPSKAPLIISIVAMVFAIIIGVVLFVVNQTTITELDKKITLQQTKIDAEVIPVQENETVAMVETVSEEDQVLDKNMKIVSELWFENNKWTSWYKAKNSNGDLAISVLERMGESQRLPGYIAKELYQKHSYDKERKYLVESVSLLNCAQSYYASQHKGEEGMEEYTPGFEGVDFLIGERFGLTLDGSEYKDVYEVYLSDEEQEDEMKNRWPILYGPFDEVPGDLIDSFEEIECIK